MPIPAALTATSGKAVWFRANDRDGSRKMTHAQRQKVVTRRVTCTPFPYLSSGIYKKPELRAHAGGGTFVIPAHPRCNFFVVKLYKDYYCRVTVIFGEYEVYTMVMETVQIRLTEKQIRNIDVLVKRGVYPNRSEAVRDAVRKLVEEGNN